MGGFAHLLICIVLEVKMLWKPDLSWCFLLTVGVATVGCGSATVQRDTVAESPQGETASVSMNTNQGDTTEGADAAEITQVSLDLPGMT